MEISTSGYGSLNLSDTNACDPGKGPCNPTNGGKYNSIGDINAFDIKYTITDPFGCIKIKTGENGATRGETPYVFTINKDEDKPVTPAPSPPTPPPPPAPAPPCISPGANVHTCPPDRISCYSMHDSPACSSYTGPGLKCCSKGNSPTPQPTPTYTSTYNSTYTST